MVGTFADQIDEESAEQQHQTSDSPVDRFPISGDKIPEKLDGSHQKEYRETIESDGDQNGRQGNEATEDGGPNFHGDRWRIFMGVFGGRHPDAFKPVYSVLSDRFSNELRGRSPIFA